MATLKEAREALAKLQSHIDVGSMTGAQLAVIAAYLAENVSNNLLREIIEDGGCYYSAIELDRLDGEDWGNRVRQHLHQSGAQTSTACATQFSRKVCFNCLLENGPMPGCNHD